MTLDSDTHRFSNRPDLGLRRCEGKCAGKSKSINTIGLELGLRGIEHSLAHNPNEIRALNPELGLRDVPGKSVQWRRQPERFRRPFPLRPILDPARDEVVGMPLPPCLLLLSPPCGLAIRVAACALTRSDSGIGTEPVAANRTRFLSGVRHGDSSSPLHQIPGAVSSVFLPVGQSRRAKVGQFW